MKDIYSKPNSTYLQNHPTWHAADSLWKAQQIMSIIKKNGITPKTIVEVGCGAGGILNHLSFMLPNDTFFWGYDIAEDAINLARPKESERLKFNCADFLHSTPTNTIDLLLLIDVFEHVEDYLGFLSALRNKTQKYTIFHIPLDLSVQAILRNKQIVSRKSVGHLHYFTKETAIATLQDTGYNIIDSFYTKSLQLPCKSIKAKAMRWPRKILYAINKDFAVKLLGGFSLLVLAENSESENENQSK